MKDPIRFDQPHPPYGRINVFIGQVKVGVIHRAQGKRFEAIFDWVLYSFGRFDCIRGTEKSELAAKNAIAEAINDFLIKAGLKE